MRMDGNWWVAVVFLVVAGCDQHVAPLPEHGGPVFPSSRTMGGISPTPVPSVSGGGSILSGTISIAPDLSAKLDGSEVLFVMARRGMGGPPMAVKRIQQPKFPLTYTLSAADQMVQGQPFSGEVSVVARIDRDGSAGPPGPGDMEGLIPQTVIGNTGVDIIIDRAY
ncbi:MAG: hypothetical protein FJY97_03510 [candidate division Zixibacteria bacterium]|nr:hypothetical protein [candidate division Zixibacteria bacterium]